MSNTETGPETPTETGTETHTESHDPAVPEAYSAFMRTGWAEREIDLPPHPVAEWAGARREQLIEQFPGERLVIPAGGFKVRANDTDYRFRAETAHTYLCGNQTSDAVLVIEDGESVLYARPNSSRETDEFFRDREYGELWAGRRPTLNEISSSLGVETRHIDDLSSRLSGSAKTRVLRGVDSRVDGQVSGDEGQDSDFARVLSELRLVKDEWEIAELQGACDITTLGFEDSVREWDRVLEFGERWIEGTFFRRARAMGNDIGYDSIVGGGRHATTLHWIENTGPVTPGELLLLDMGAEASSLYTADVTRTLPVNGHFTPVQRDLYSLVLEAQRAGIAAVRPGAAFRAPHEAAMSVLAHGLEDLGLLPVPAEEALSPGQPGLRPLDPARDQPHARHGRARLCGLPDRHLPRRRPGGRDGADGRARPLLPGGRPAGAGGAARHRHPDRGRHRGHHRRRAEPVRRPAAGAGRHRGLDGESAHADS